MTGICTFECEEEKGVWVGRGWRASMFLFRLLSERSVMKHSGERQRASPEYFYPSSTRAYITISTNQTYRRGVEMFKLGYLFKIAHEGLWKRLQLNFRNPLRTLKTKHGQHCIFATACFDCPSLLMCLQTNYTKIKKG